MPAPRETPSTPPDWLFAVWQMVLIVTTLAVGIGSTVAGNPLTLIVLQTAATILILGALGCALFWATQRGILESARAKLEDAPTDQPLPKGPGLEA